MSASPSATNINDKILEAAESARNHPYVQKLIDDEQTRDNAVATLMAARKAFDRASTKGWDKKLAKDKKLRRDVEDALSGLKQTRSELLEAGKPKKSKKSHKLRKLVFIAVIGTIIAIAINDDARKSVLDALFGAEEEFQYSSTTASSTNGAA